MSQYSSLVNDGHLTLDAQFEKDVEMAKELSRITAAQENERRQRLGLPLLTSDNGSTISHSQSFPHSLSDEPAKAVKVGSRPRIPTPTSFSQKESSTNRQAPSDNAAVRPRPRPLSTGRSASPRTISARREAIIDNTNLDTSDNPLRKSANWEPLSISPNPIVSSKGSSNGTNQATLWEDFGINSTADPFAICTTSFLSPTPFEVPTSTLLANTCSATSTSTVSQFDSTSFKKSTVIPFAPESTLLEADVNRPRADSSSNLIALSPMSKEKIHTHYKLDLDSLYEANRSSTLSTSRVTPTSHQTASQQPIRTPTQSTGSWQAANSRPIPAPRVLPTNVTSDAQPQSNSNNYLLPDPKSQQGSAFAELEEIFTVKSDTSIDEPSLPMPTTKAPGLPTPPPLPARNSASSSSKVVLQTKRASAPNGDLLDLKQGMTLEVSSVHLFDPLFSPPEELKKGFDEQLTNLNARLNAKPNFTVTATIEEDDEVETQLQDPFSFEELSMALMTTKVLGVYESIDDREVADEDVIQSQASNIYETINSFPSKDPTPEKPLKSRSFSITSQKGTRMTEEETMDEFTAFSVMVARLKSDYKYDDNYTNLGILFSPTVNIAIPDGLTVEVTVLTDMASEPVCFRTDVTTSVEILIWNVMSNISGDFLEVSVDDYILKVFNYSEYLVNDSNLSDYAYTHNCLKLKEPIKFSLHAVAALNKPFLRKPGDDEEPIYMIKDELHGDKSYKVQPKDLKVLYDVFTELSESVNTQALERGLGTLCIKNLLQSVKAITMHLLGAETLEIKLAIRRLERTLSEAGSSTSEVAKLAELMDDFQRAMEGLTTGVRDLLTMYCATFHVRYSHPNSHPKHKETVNVNDSDENILIHVGSVHRIADNIRAKFDHYKVIVSLYYAGLKVCEHVSTDVHSSLTEERFMGTIYFDQWLEMTDFPMSFLPPETRVLFTLCAMNTSQPVRSSGNNAHNKWVNIGWVSFMFIDFRRNVTQGKKLLSLWRGVPNISGATGSNIWQPNTTLLQINLPEFGFDIQFPPPLPQTPKFIERQTEEVKLLAGDLMELNSILAKNDKAMTKEDKEFMWSKRETLQGLSEALPKVLLSAPLFSGTGIPVIQDLLNNWAPLNALEALRLLLPDFPCQQIRNYAVKCLKTVSSDEMCDYLPQIVQAMKFENYHDSELVRLLLERCITSIKLAQQLYWSLKEGASQLAHRERYKVLFGGLVSVMGKSLREEMEREEALVHHCQSLAEKVKQAKGDSREKVMAKEAHSLHDLFSKETLRLPTNPGFEVNGLDLKLCTYFNSFTTPLKLVFKSVEHSAPNHYLMYKIGDDLRQDMVVMQLINIMDKLWLQNDLDLKLVTFSCLPTGDKRGMVELVPECETLAKIQGFSGITGSFKDQPLANWLHKHNPTHTDYQRAVENFTLSCAGYCVATYILGIGDRHNDNIMVKRSGHIFHIDFSKFLGDAQMFGAFKRDRTPFILTKDMAYVINGSDKQGQSFQDFVDLCCEAFNIIREQSDGLLTLLNLMTSSGIKGLTSQAVQYVRTALLPERTNSEATASFTRMIEESLQSKFVQWNFFIHNLAQLKFSSHSDGDLLSFIPNSYSMATDGRIINVEIFDYQKRYQPEKHYIYIIKVHRENQRDPTLVYRRYSEFQEFYGKLVSLFPLANIPRLPGSVVLGRTHVQKVAEKRKAELEMFLRELLTLAKEISEHDLLYTFFHPMLRDETETVATDTTTFTDSAVRPNIKTIKGEVLLSMHYKQGALHIMVKHARGVGYEGGDRPNPYVKMYLLPDPIKTTKRKTKVSRSTFHPVYNEMFEYRLPMKEARERTLQVTVWSAELTGRNEFLGAIHINLYETDFSKEWTEWHKLSTLHCIKS